LRLSQPGGWCFLYRSRPPSFSSCLPDFRRVITVRRFSSNDIHISSAASSRRHFADIAGFRRLSLLPPLADSRANHSH